MAEMLIQSESLTKIADKIRVLSGTTEAMGLDAMESHVDEANENVDTEASLISQIQAALEGKTAGSGEVNLPDAETKTFGMQTFKPGWSWFKVGYQGENGYWQLPNITEEMTNGHPYLILLSYESGDTYIDEIIATATQMFLNPNNQGLYTAEPTDHFIYHCNYDTGIWEQVTVTENYGQGVPSTLLSWSNYDIKIAAEFGGGDSGWIGYEPIEGEVIENGEFTPVNSKYQITGEMMNRLAAELQMKTGYQNMLTPAEMLNRIANTSMFCFESSASGWLLG